MGNQRRSGLLVLAAVLTLFALPGRTLGVVTLEIGSASGHPGEEISIPVTLRAEVEVSAAQNDIAFGPEVQVVGCTKNEAIGKEATTFAFRPTGCERGVTCDSLRAIVVSFENVAPIPDGAVLYACQVRIGTDAPVGSYPLACRGPVAASPPVSVPLDTTCTDGQIEVVPVPEVTIAVGSTTAGPGETVVIDVTLDATNVQVVAAQNDLIFPPQIRVESCSVNPDLGKDDSAFNLERRDCGDQMSCDMTRALVLSLDDVEPIPDGAILYSCAVSVAPDTLSGTALPLRCERAGTSRANAQELVTACTDGTIEVVVLCSGDCNGNGTVPVDELVTGVNIALGRAALGTCSAFDGNANGSVSVDELVSGVIATLDGC